MHNGLPIAETLTSDIPKAKPDEDQYGYARFASLIAKAIITTPSPQGLIMAVHGAWGSGKSTLLNFVKHDLALPENANKILVVDFNPWWFNDRNHLATQFLARFSSALKQDPSFVLKVGNLMSDYADALALAATTSVGLPAASGFVSGLLKFFKIKTKEIPELKENIARVMLQSNRRVLFLIDDIDRLTPSEIRELFKVLKALADFPNVLYLLSFDRGVVQQALSSSLGVDGAAYLEKIVQVPFTLPAVDRQHLRKDLFSRLDVLLKRCTKNQFDSDYWQNIYFSGIDTYINKPRDIVRLANALFVTYPPLAGEVNAVDFFALEVLRLFESDVYELIRDNSQMFIGYRDQNRDENDPISRFHEKWLSLVPERRRDSVKKMISEMFPKVASTWGGSGYGSDWTGTWRGALRVCSPELFETFFQFGLPDGNLSRAELDLFLEMAERGSDIGTLLLEAGAVTRSNGSTKVWELVERLKDLKDEITPAAAQNILRALFLHGSSLLGSEEDAGMFGIPAHWRLLWAIDHLLDRIPPSDRYVFLSNLIASTPDMTIPLHVINKIHDNLTPGGIGRDKAFNSFSIPESEGLVSKVLSRLEIMESADFVMLPDLAPIAYTWLRLGGTSKVREKIGALFLRPELLPRLLDDFKSVGRSQVLGKAAVTRTVSLNPKNLEDIIEPQALQPLIEAALLRDDLTSDQRLAATSYIRQLSGDASDDPDDASTGSN